MSQVHVFLLPLISYLVLSQSFHIDSNSPDDADGRVALFGVDRFVPIELEIFGRASYFQIRGRL